MFKPFYRLENIVEYLKNNVNILVHGPLSTERNLYIKNHIVESETCLHICIEREQNNSNFVLKGNGKTYIIQDKISDLPKLLNSYNINKSTVLLDITSLDQSIFFYLIKLFITSIKPKFLFSGYTSPINYIKNIDNFELSESLQENGSFPGFARRENPGQEKIIVIILGYESGRITQLIESISPDPEVYIIISYPGISPETKQTIFEKNYIELNKLQLESTTYYASLNHPFDVINILKRIETANPKKQLFVAPLGPRPLTLGAAIFSVLNNKVIPVYDFPLEKTLRSNGIKDCFVSDLSSLIKIL